jgi:hypothetical protein
MSDVSQIFLDNYIIACLNSPFCSLMRSVMKTDNAFSCKLCNEILTDKSQPLDNNKVVLIT